MVPILGLMRIWALTPERVTFSATYSSTMAVNVQPDPLTGPSPLRDIVRPQFHQNNFVQELFIKNELGLKLDKGA